MEATLNDHLGPLTREIKLAGILMLDEGNQIRRVLGTVSPPGEQLENDQVTGELE